MSHERAESGGDAFVGKSLDGRYLIRERIGAGGMGMVYRGLQISIGREVAIKVVHPAMLGDRNAARRFLREVSLAARLSSPHTVQVIDFGETAEGTLYLVMELLSGAPLRS
ncbi:MAG: protein kinase, partial [Deltaproteobacteria bacterium]|nr:protein kinase [Kofleriaceae bacterium]